MAETEKSASRDRNVDNFIWDETETLVRLKTETTTLQRTRNPLQQRVPHMHPNDIHLLDAANQKLMDTKHYINDRLLSVAHIHYFNDDNNTYLPSIATFVAQNKRRHRFISTASL